MAITLDSLAGNAGGDPAAADQVRTALAVLLRRRLRQADVVGRCGTDDFAVLLEDITETDALRLSERLREEFGTLLHIGAGGPFTATFRAGVAALQDGERLSSWSERAARAGAAGPPTAPSPGTS